MWTATFRINDTRMFTASRSAAVWRSTLPRQGRDRDHCLETPCMHGHGHCFNVFQTMAHCTELPLNTSVFVSVIKQLHDNARSVLPLKGTILPRLKVSCMSWSRIQTHKRFKRTLFIRTKTQSACLIAESRPCLCPNK